MMEATTYPVSDDERREIHAASSRAADAITEAVPAEYWPLISDLVNAHRTRAALYGYVCADDADLRHYIGLPD